MRSFTSFGQFGRHLVALAAEGEAVCSHITAEAGKLVLKDAQKRIGTYQGEVGPFTAWAPLAESTKEDRARQGYPEDEPLLRSGALRDSYQVESKHDEMVVGSDSDIALYQETGTATIPPRPVLGPALIEQTDPILGMGSKTAAAWVAGIGWKRPQLEDSE